MHCRQVQMIKMLLDTNPELAHRLGVSQNMLEEVLKKQEAFTALQVILIMINIISCALGNLNIINIIHY